MIPRGRSVVSVRRPDLRLDFGEVAVGGVMIARGGRKRAVSLGLLSASGSQIVIGLGPIAVACSLVALGGSVVAVGSDAVAADGSARLRCRQGAGAPLGVKDGEQRLEHCRVEMGSRTLAHHLEGLVLGERGPVHTVVSEGVINVSDRGDP